MTTGFQYMVGSESEYKKKDGECDLFIIAYNLYDCIPRGEPGFNQCEFVSAQARYKWLTNDDLKFFGNSDDLVDVDFIGRRFIGLRRRSWASLPKIVDHFAKFNRPLMLKLHSCEVRWTKECGEFNLENLERAMVKTLSSIVSPFRYMGCPPCCFSNKCYWACCAPWNYSSEVGKAWVRRTWQRVADEGLCACGQEGCKSTQHWAGNLEDASSQHRFKAEKLQVAKAWNAFECMRKPDGTPAWSYYEPYGFHITPEQKLPLAIFESSTPQCAASWKDNKHRALRPLSTGEFDVRAKAEAKAGAGAGAGAGARSATENPRSTKRKRSESTAPGVP